jgi:hypothetical protein
MSMFYVCTCTLFYTFLPPLDKADLTMAFAEQLKLAPEMENASPMIFESQFTVSQPLNPSGSE